MYRKFVRRTWIIQLTVVSLIVFCLAYTGVRAINLKSRIIQTVDPNAISPQANRLDGVVILSQSLPGIAREQTLSLKFQNPRTNRESDDRPMPIQVRLMDAAGNAVSETRQITVPPGGFALINFKRTDVALPGDSLTGRVDTTAEVRTMPLWSVQARTHFLFEVIDDLTGKTTVAGQFVVGDLKALP